MDPGCRGCRPRRGDWEQAEVLVHVLDELPDDLDPGLRRKAEAHLLAEAGHFDPVALRRLGRHALEVIAPEVADAHAERSLLAEEQRARAVTRLSFRPRPDGVTDVFARVPDHVADRLRVYLDAYTSPRRVALDSEVDGLPLSRRRGEAFCALLEHIPAAGLPRHGGAATAVLVTLDLDTLRSGLGLAETSTGDLVSASEARRLACTAVIVPSSSARSRRSWTWAGPGGCSRLHSAGPWTSETAPAERRTATSPPPGVRPIMRRSPGRRAGGPI